MVVGAVIADVCSINKLVRAAAKLPVTIPCIIPHALICTVSLINAHHQVPAGERQLGSLNGDNTSANSKFKMPSMHTCRG